VLFFGPWLQLRIDSDSSQRTGHGVGGLATSFPLSAERRAALILIHTGCPCSFVTPVSRKTDLLDEQPSRKVRSWSWVPAGSSPRRFTGPIPPWARSSGGMLFVARPLLGLTRAVIWVPIWLRWGGAAWLRHGGRSPCTQVGCCWPSRCSAARWKWWTGCTSQCVRSSPGWLAPLAQRCIRSRESIRAPAQPGYPGGSAAD
jgi:hypothetical protein